MSSTVFSFKLHFLIAQCKKAINFITLILYLNTLLELLVVVNKALLLLTQSFFKSNPIPYKETHISSLLNFKSSSLHLIMLERISFTSLKDGEEWAQFPLSSH